MQSQLLNVLCLSVLFLLFFYILLNKHHVVSGYLRPVLVISVVINNLSFFNLFIILFLLFYCLFMKFILFGTYYP